MTDLWFVLLGWMFAMWVVLGGFDLGAGMVHLMLARSEDERQALAATVKPVWKGNDVFLIAAGGTMFCAFPALLATAFSGFYLPIMLVLWVLVPRALGLELRSALDDRLWRQACDVAWSLGSLALALLFGAALGNVVRGVSLDGSGIFFAPLWTDFGVGGPQVGVLDWYTILVGVTAVVLLAHHGVSWIAWRAGAGDVIGVGDDKSDSAGEGDHEHGDGREASGKGASRLDERAALVGNRLMPLAMFLVLACTFATWGVQPQLSENLLAHPWGGLFLVLALGGLVLSSVCRGHERQGAAFACSCLALTSLLSCAAFGIHPFVLPARDAAHGLTAAAAAAHPEALWTALGWWIPGMTLACTYALIMHRRATRSP
jgi:cytochrome d ubiquinol oxidase subunit II